MKQTKQLVPAIIKTESVKIPARMQMMDRVMMVEKVLNIPRVSLVLIARIAVFVKAKEDHRRQQQKLLRKGRISNNNSGEVQKRRQRRGLCKAMRLRLCCGRQCGQS